MTARFNIVVFAVTALAYLVAVTQRSSLGAAGVAAAEHFSVGATQLATLGVTQIIVYAALQIPVGMLLDRFGASRLIATGAILMVIGQGTVALAPDLSGAVLGRMLVGAGDATTYVSGLRLINAWFPARRVPIMSQWYATLGQLGQVLSAVPFAVLLGAVTWTPAFLSLAGLSVVSLVITIVVLRDAPGRRTDANPVSLRIALGKVAGAMRHPGTRLGFWTHFTTQFSMTVFSLLWGYPLMVQGLGYTPEAASMLLALVVVAGMIGGPIIGLLTARFPFRRSNLVLGIAGTTLVTWLVFLLWTGLPPAWLVMLHIVVLGVGGVGSNIGFDLARTSNPAERFGSASGFVNVGGFTATFVSMFLIGVLLDLVSPGGAPPSFDSYRVAFLVMPAFLVLGMTAIWIVRRKARRRMAADEGIIVGPLWVALVRRWRRPSGES